MHSSAGRYGSDRQLALLAGGLDRARWRPLVVLPFEGPLAGDLAAAGVETLIGPVPVVRRELLTASGMGRLAREAARARRALDRLARERRAALVHLNTSAILPAAAPPGVPLAVHVREIYTGWGPLWPPYRSALERAGALLCVSAAVRAQFRGRGVVVPDGLAAVPERVPRDAARTALGLPADAFVVAVLGRISAWKGQDVLARALAEPELRGAIGLVAGDTWPGQEHRADELRAAAAGLGDRLRLLGFRDDVGTVLGAADVVAVPSTRPDPLPNAALEAAAAGCCVVAANHGGLPEIVTDGATGVLVAPGDHRALAAALAGLATDPGRARRLGAAAALDIRARFTPERLLKRTQAIYETLLNRQGEPCRRP